MRSMQNDIKALATTRLKTDEEVATEKKEKLEAMEVRGTLRIIPCFFFFFFFFF